MSVLSLEIVEGGGVSAMKIRLPRYDAAQLRSQSEQAANVHSGTALPVGAASHETCSAQAFTE